jgi:FkbM family methyltransferase
MLNWLSAFGRELFRWYLRHFPLRDGKSFFYRALHPLLAPPDGFVVARLAPGFSMKLHLREAVQRRIYFFGDYDERYEADMVRRLLDRGEIFWDIGANIGYYSLLAALTLENTGQVVAFEPGNVAYARLTENIALNPYSNIICWKLAAADRSGPAILHLLGHTADGGATLYGSGSGRAVQESVKAVALDEFSRQEGLQAPDFIKIDVEGAELTVLHGAEAIIGRSLPLLLLEMKEATLLAAGTGKAELQEFLRSFGYLAAFPHKRKWYAAEEVGSVKSRNILWFNPAVPKHRQKLARLPLLGDY